MLQIVATIASLLVLMLGAGILAASLSSDWALMLRALGLRHGATLRPAMLPLPPQVQTPQGRPIVFARQIRVVRISSPSVPRRAAA
jgi:hypothetical protein